MDDRFMQERPITGLVLSLSVPMALSMLINALYNIVDGYFVAKLSEAALTAVSLDFPVQNAVNAVAIGFGVGVNAAISFFLGAGQSRQAARTSGLSFLLSALHGLLLALLCTAILPGFLALFTSDPEVLQLGICYGRTVFPFAPAICLYLFYEKLFQATGRMFTSTIALIIGCVSNIILDPLLIFGVGPFPPLGIRGAGLATGLAQCLTLLFYLVVFALRPASVQVRPAILCQHEAADLPLTALAGRLYAVGIPAILNQALPSLLVSALNGILSGISQSHVLVLGVYYKLQTFLYLTANGIVQAIRPLVGFNHGAGRPDRVRGIFLTALWISALLMAGGTLVCLVFPEHLFGLFTNNPQTIALAGTALPIISIGFLPSALSVVAGGAMEGLGKGMHSLIISLLRYLVAILPLAWVLCHILGGTGVWIAFAITEWLSALISLALCRSTRIL